MPRISGRGLATCNGVVALALALVFATVEPSAAGAAATGQRTASADACSFPTSEYDAQLPPGEGFPNDPLYSRQWGLQQIKAPAAWARGARGAGTVIAVLDSGVDSSHPDLAGKLLSGADFGPESGCSGAQDENGHGTAVAGIAAATTNNGIGVAGVAPRARILPVKTGDESEAHYRRLPEAIRWSVDHGADVINLSDALPYTELEHADELADAVRYAYDRGVVFVAAAGNTVLSPQVSALPWCADPAINAYVVCVAASDKRGLPAGYSNLPLKSSGVAVRAPGGSGVGLAGRFTAAVCDADEHLWTTYWPGLGQASHCRSGGYAPGFATSLAAPHVAGVAALLAGRGLNAEDILDCLRETSSNRGSYDPIMGYGIVDADAATRECRPG